MDVSLTPEQQMLVDAVRTLARTHALDRPPDRPPGDHALDRSPGRPPGDDVVGGSRGRPPGDDVVGGSSGRPPGDYVGGRSPGDDAVGGSSDRPLGDHVVDRSPDRLPGDHVRGGSAGLGESAAVDDRVWEKLAGMGLLELRLPVSPSTAASPAGVEAVAGPAGGPGTGVEAALVTEALAYHLVAVPYVGVLVASDLVVRAGVTDELVGDVTSGRRRVVPVLDPSLRRLAGPGEAGVAWDSAGADSGLVLDEAGELSLVPLGSPLPDVADLTREARTLCRNGPIWATSAQSTEERGLGRLDADGRQRVEALLLTLVTADMLGTAAGALDRAIEHVTQRVQFDRPVGSFQAVQHLCADATVAIEASRSALWHAAWAVDELPASEALAAARTAKAFAAPELVAVCETAIQLHGGIGMTWESLIHVHLRRALLDRQVLGDESHQLDALAGVVG